MIRICEKEPVCGGTDVAVDPKAPKEILSDAITVFDVASVLPRCDAAEGEHETPQFVSAFAAPAESGAFLFLEQGAAFPVRGPRTREWALVREDVFPALAALVRECGLAKQNGSHFHTHGLPENFGGSIRILYAGGEEIRVSDNRSPVLPAGAGERTAAFFAAAMRRERAALPPASALREIRFSQQRQNGGFTATALALHGDGAGTVSISRRFDDPRVYERRAELDGAALAQILRCVEDSGMLAWPGLPRREYAAGEDKSLTFAFADGTERVVPDGLWLPDPLRGEFFKIEFALTKV